MFVGEQSAALLHCSHGIVICVECVLGLSCWISNSLLEENFCSICSVSCTVHRAWSCYGLLLHIPVKSSDPAFRSNPVRFQWLCPPVPPPWRCPWSSWDQVHQHMLIQMWGCIRGCWVAAIVSETLLLACNNCKARMSGTELASSWLLIRLPPFHLFNLCIKELAKCRSHYAVGCLLKKAQMPSEPLWRL